MKPAIEFSLRADFESVEQQARANEDGLWEFEDDAGATGTQTTTATETETKTETEAGDSDSGGGGGGSDLPPPSGGASDPYDCSDFDSQDQAQRVLETPPATLRGSTRTTTA